LRIYRKCKCRFPNELHLCIANTKSFLSVHRATVSMQPLLHSSQLQRFPMGPTPLKLAPSHGVSGPHLIRGSFGSPSQHPKWHLDRFSRFAGLTKVTNRQTDRPTNNATPCVAIGRYALAVAAMRTKTSFCATPFKTYL